MVNMALFFVGLSLLVLLLLLLATVYFVPRVLREEDRDGRDGHPS